MEVAEQIDVLVLMPWGDIVNKQLTVYELDIPEPEPESETNQKIWVWHSEDDERICDDCAEYDGNIFEDPDDIPYVPLHPNCRCWVEEIELDDIKGPHQIYGWYLRWYLGRVLRWALCNSKL